LSFLQTVTPPNIEELQSEQHTMVEGVNRVRKRFFIFVAAVALMALADSAGAGSVGDFFKALGNSIAHPGQNRKAKPRDSKTVSKRSKTKGTVSEADYPPGPTATPVILATPTATIHQVPVRVASLPTPTKRSKRDLPYAIPVPNKPGFVTSPYAPKQGLVDVRGFASGTEVIDPYTGKVFLTP
jgi:hypothetical protein